MIWLPGVARERRAVRIQLALWTTGIVLITTLPWSNFQGHAHWAQVNWVPFASRFDNPRDVILNGIVFGIFGYLFARAFPANRPSVTLARAWILAAVLSASVEFYQVFSHGRFANMTDFVMNNAGGGTGGRRGEAPKRLEAVAGRGAMASGGE